VCHHWLLALSSLFMPPEFGHAAEPSAAPRCDGSGGTFQTVARRQVRTVRKRGTERTALAFQRSAFGWEAVHRTALDAVAARRSARVEIGTP